ncbi:N-acetylmuramoyl-L-alanine amidase [Pseudonocardia acidicola]|uniref:N-acetylmuramoyl-L-alanine amidase n=1 Tax=Pseudonocardia acidicola TaxID=2724939 RepID=A0ABX1SJ15_9PSEU|nr:N-acetylmuramoyl-L-alanine amidase [Pseudonocardia acidicola]
MSAPRRSVPIVLSGLFLAATLGSCAGGVGGGPVTPALTAATATSDAARSATDPAGPAAPGAAAAPAARTPVVVLDPGHNGGNASNPQVINQPVPDGRGGTKSCNTTGTATDTGYSEHAFNWDVAQRVSALLTQRGIRVALTRPDDTGVGPCVDERGAAGAKDGADAVVSIHADGSAPANHGFHVAYSDPPLNAAQSGPAHTLAAALRDRLRDAGFPVSDYIGRDGLSPRPDLAGLNLSTRPAALVECANMRNPQEAALVSSPDGRARYAAAIAAGIEAFLGR